MRSKWNLTSSIVALLGILILGIPPSVAQFGGDAFSGSTYFGRTYEEELRQRVRAFWHPPSGKSWNDAVVEFTLNKNGTISQITTKQSSGLKIVDDSVIMAVRQAAPYPELPAGHSQSRIQLHFDGPPPAPPVVATGPNPAPNNGKTHQESENVVSQEDVDFGPWMADLTHRLKLFWRPVGPTKLKRTVVVFKIHKDGHLSHLRLNHSSGVATIDSSALAAVKDAAPFRKLPAGAPEDVDIQFAFDDLRPDKFGFTRSGDVWVGWMNSRAHGQGTFRQF